MSGPERGEADPAPGRAAADFLSELEGPILRVTGALADLKILGNVRADRMKLRLQRLAAQGLGFLGLAAIALALAVAGAMLLASGIAGGLRALFAERPWLGDIVAGSALLAAVVSVWFAARATNERATTRRLEEKYAERERERSPGEPGPEPRGGAAAGRDAGARAPAG